jgi:hypothetical protein
VAQLIAFKDPLRGRTLEGLEANVVFFWGADDEAGCLAQSQREVGDPILIEFIGDEAVGGWEAGFELFRESYSEFGEPNG